MFLLICSLLVAVIEDFSVGILTYSVLNHKTEVTDRPENEESRLMIRLTICTQQ